MATWQGADQLLSAFNVATFKNQEDDKAFWNRLIPVTEQPLDEDEIKQVCLPRRSFHIPSPCTCSSLARCRVDGSLGEEEIMAGAGNLHGPTCLAQPLHRCAQAWQWHCPGAPLTDFVTPSAGLRFACLDWKPGLMSVMMLTLIS